MLAVLAVGLELVVSANLLSALGVPYVTDGGALPLKLHPGTLVLLAAAILAWLRGGTAWLRRIDPLLWLFAAALCGCAVFMLVLTGASNLIVLFDTFLPAGLLAMLLSHAPPRVLRRLRTTMQLVLFGNALLALGEMAAQATLVPLYLDDAVYHAEVVDFRPTALFDHPLTGSMMMMIALAIAPAGRWRWPYLAAVWAALVVFGGRTALGLSLAGVTMAHASGLARRILTRDRTAPLTLMLAAGGLAGAALAAAVAVACGLGGRLSGHLYWDASAQVRLAQWQILGQLDCWQLLFGVPREHLLAELNVLTLGSGVHVIENFWLLMFVSLGAVGFPLFLLMFASLGLWCWRVSAGRGRMLLLGIVLAASSSNSLGRKSTLLVCLVAGVAALCPAAGQVLRRARGGVRWRRIAWQGEPA